VSGRRGFFAATLLSFTVGGMPVLLKVGFVIYLIGLSVLASFVSRRCGLWMTVWRTLCLLYADAGHIAGHAVSARRVGAPMKGVVLRAFPITLYPDDSVRPHQHIGRALGGPLFSLLSALAGLALRGLTRPQTTLREMADWFVIPNALLGASSLLPGPQLDGGVILRWGILYRGDETASYALARRVALFGTVGLAAAGVGLLARGRYGQGGLALGAAGTIAFGLVRFQ
jgi:Zn-dependent protease